jgi:hypothetical protein
MANEVTAAAVAGVVNTSLIKEINDYPIDANVLLPRLAWAQVGGSGTNTAAFAVPAKSTAVAAPGDGTAMTAAAFTYSNVTAAAGEFGILRIITKSADRFSVLGDGGVSSAAVLDGVRLCLEYAETQALAGFVNASTSVGTTGQTMSIANMSQAISKASTNKAKGNGYYVLTTFQARDLRSEIVNSSAPILSFVGGAQILSGPDSQGYTGTFLGKPVYETNLCPSASSDKVGAYLMDDSQKMAPLGCALGWMPEAVALVNPVYPGNSVAVTMCAGFVEKQDKGYVKIVSIGS